MNVIEDNGIPGPDVRTSELYSLREIIAIRLIWSPLLDHAKVGDVRRLVDCMLRDVQEFMIAFKPVDVSQGAPESPECEDVS